MTIRVHIFKERMGRVSSEIPSGNVVTPAASHPSISTHKYCSLRRSSQNRGKEGGRAEKRRETKREMSRWEFYKRKSYYDSVLSKEMGKSQQLNLN